MAAPKKTDAKQAPVNGKPVPGFTKDQELAAYRDMLTIRRFEEKAGQMYGMGLIGGFCHLYIGQEAVVVGMQMVLKEGDEVITGYRDHGHMLACGMDPKGVMAELTGRRGGYSKGKGGKNVCRCTISEYRCRKHWKCVLPVGPRTHKRECRNSRDQ